MTLLIKLAWRNIWRNKRRSIFTLAAMIFAVYLAIAQRGLQIGTYNMNIENVVELFSGYLQVQTAHYNENPVLKENFVMNAEIQKAIQSVTEITGFSTRVNADGMVYFNETARGSAIVGIDPEMEKDVTVLLKSIHQGVFFKDASSDDIVIGDRLLKNLQANIGDKILVMTQGLDGIVHSRNFRICGTLKLGIPELESSMVFMPLKTAQNLLAMGDKVNVISLKIDQLYHSDRVRKKLGNLLIKDRLEILSWKELNPELKQAIAIDNISGILMLVILFVIVAFGILNTILMSITERFREFGVALAVGLPNKSLVYLIFLETLFISLLGLIIGNVLGYFTNYYLIHNPISLGEEAQKLTEIYHFLPQMTSTLQPSIFFHVSLSVFIISIVASIYPACKVYKLEPLKGIRHT